MKSHIFILRFVPVRHSCFPSSDERIRHAQSLSLATPLTELLINQKAAIIIMPAAQVAFAFSAFQTHFALLTLTPRTFRLRVPLLG